MATRPSPPARSSRKSESGDQPSGDSQAQTQPARAGPVGRQVEARGERRANLPGDVHVHRDGRGSGARRHPRPGHVHGSQVALREQRRGDREAHLALLALGDGERAHLVEVAAHRAQQRRVDQAPDDVLVDTGRLIGTQDGPLQRFRPARQHQVADGAAGRHRHDDARLRKADGVHRSQFRRVAELQPVARDDGAVGDVYRNLEGVQPGNVAGWPPAVDVAGWDVVDGRVLGQDRSGRDHEGSQDGREGKDRSSHGGASVCGWVMDAPGRCTVPARYRAWCDTTPGRVTRVAANCAEREGVSGLDSTVHEHHRWVAAGRYATSEWSLVEVQDA